jgi:DNA-binding winged helix-turn-helix (wHTH) protein
VDNKCIQVFFEALNMHLAASLYSDDAYVVLTSEPNGSVPDAPLPAAGLTGLQFRAMLPNYVPTRALSHPTSLLGGGKMSIHIHLIIADPARCDWLKSTLKLDPDFIVVSESPNIEEGPYPETHLFMVDLTHPLASQPRFWMIVHAFYPGARLMAMTEPPIKESILQTALLAGAYHMVEWTDPPERVLYVAHEAACGSMYVPLGAVVIAMMALFSKMNQEIRGAQVDTADGELMNCRTTGRNDHRSLSPLEFSVLSYLAQHCGHVVSAAEVLRAAWPPGLPVYRSRNRLKGVIKRLRQKIEPDPKHPRYLRTAHGDGYYLSSQFQWEKVAAWPAGSAVEQNVRLALRN